MEMEEVFLSLNIVHYHIVKKKEYFIALATLGCLKMERVPQKADEGQQDLARVIMIFNICTDKIT